MNEQPALLHNMSAPPKTVVKYSGLSELARTSGPGGSGVAGVTFKGREIHGTPVRCMLGSSYAGRTPEKLLAALGHEPVADVERRLAELINARAQELPLPDGCVVIAGRSDALVIWQDPLAALAILAKCSDYVWLRAKTPAIHAALRRNTVTLLIPPQFAARIPELQPDGVSVASAQSVVEDVTVSAGQSIAPPDVEPSAAPKPHFMRRGGTGLNRR